MSNPELQFMQTQVNDLQNSLERVREERDELKLDNSALVSKNESLNRQIVIYGQMVERMQIAMAQGLEL